MTIKDFDISGRVYTVKKKRGSDGGFERSCRTVTSIGRKYVKAGPYEFYAPENTDEYFVEKTPYSPEYRAFPTAEAADEYVERENLRQWLREAATWSQLEKYSIGQLRAVKDILQKSQTTESLRKVKAILEEASK